MPLELKLLLAGLGVGVLVGLTGMGGGAIMTPLLILLGIPATVAVGTDLAYAAVTKTVGAWRHARLQHVNYRLVLWFALGSVPAAVLGVLTLRGLESRLGDGADHVIQLLLAGMVLVAGIAVLVRTLVARRAAAVPERDGRLSRRDRIVAPSVGLVFGYLLGLTSIGSGTFFGMALLIAFHLRAQRIVGTDIFHAAILVWAAAIAHATITHTVQFGTVGWLLVGSVPGILVGAQWTARAPERVLRVVLAGTLCVSGGLLLLA